MPNIRTLRNKFYFCYLIQNIHVYVMNVCVLWHPPAFKLSDGKPFTVPRISQVKLVFMHGIIKRDIIIKEDFEIPSIENKEYHKETMNM